MILILIFRDISDFSMIVLLSQKNLPARLKFSSWKVSHFIKILEKILIFLTFLKLNLNSRPYPYSIFNNFKTTYAQNQKFKKFRRYWHIRRYSLYIYHIGTELTFMFKKLKKRVDVRNNVI